MREVIRLDFNWFQRIESSEMAGEDYSQYFLGKDGVTSITEDRNEAGNFSYLVVFEQGNQIRIFNPNLVVYQLENAK